MPSFHYRALNTERAELSGVIEAPDEMAAREKLNELGISVITLEGIEAQQEGEAHVTTGKEIFEFEAFDKNGKKVVGTIGADEINKAYKRLFEEYQLNLVYLASTKATPEEKEQARAEGIKTLQALYEAEKAKTTKPVVEEAAAAQQQSEAEIKERAELDQLIDTTLSRIATFLQKYPSELKPEERDTIQSYLNQISRIKSSANLDHVRRTCGRMLKHIQEQELFINEQTKLKESAQLKLETRNLLDQLNQTGLQKDINVQDILEKWQHSFLLAPLSRFIRQAFPNPTPEVIALKTKITAINGHLRSYYKILLTGGSKALKLEAWESIKTLRQEKRRLKNELTSIKSELRQNKEAHALTGAESLESGIMGWLLALYLTAYIIAYPFTLKAQTTLELPQNFFFYESTLVKGLTLFLFIFYALRAGSRLFLPPERQGQRFALYSLGGFGLILVAINLF
ncbi:hypothetical protein CO046_05445 [Candidatus Peregrinibacteria bacterium CG_4_9_14_0_2_um_filter_53_11]|nr:MAG: hypothetical protein CO046_05445 [Candidatus Peregrinibacteria bacterium CG_4_9_14_0_2_um_filter_53_11]